jgi:hypothetical protein
MVKKDEVEKIKKGDVIRFWYTIKNLDPIWFLGSILDFFFAFINKHLHAYVFLFFIFELTQTCWCL